MIKKMRRRPEVFTIFQPTPKTTIAELIEFFPRELHERIDVTFSLDGFLYVNWGSNQTCGLTHSIIKDEKDSLKVVPTEHILRDFEEMPELRTAVTLAGSVLP
jgi:hypothetical protein